MRPRISNKEDIKITYSDMKKYLVANRCYGTYMSFIDKDTGLYRFQLMFRDTKKPPVEAKVQVSLVSKLVTKAFIGDVPCASIREFMEKVKWKKI